MSTSKNQEQKKGFIKSEWVNITKEIAIEGGKVVLQGMLFSFGGHCVSKIASVASTRRNQALIKASSNVIDISKAAKAV